MSVYFKKVKFILISFGFLLIVNFGYSQVNADLLSVYQQVDERGEARISFPFEEVMRKIEDFNKLDFDKIDSLKVYFYISADALNKFDLAHYSFNLEPIESKLLEVEMLPTAKAFFFNWNAYPTYNQYDSLMQQFQTDYPNLCKLHQLGVLPSGRKILTVQLGDQVQIDENEVRFFYTSTMHGDETTGYVMMLRLIEYLLQNYGSIPQVTQLMNQVEIWINPLANPDGTYFGGNHTVLGATRYNANSVDLNRNFSDPEDGPHPDGKPYQIETNIFMAFQDTMHFTMSANLHGGEEVVNYPWDTWYPSVKLHADNNWWIDVSQAFADTAHYYSPSGYLSSSQFPSGITNGADWYLVSGGRQDYANYFARCREFTLEISNQKTVPENQLTNYWGYLHRSFLNYIQEATYGIQGQVTDSLTGFAVGAEVTVVNHDIDNSSIFTNDSGFYFRPILSGNYSLQYTANGYQSKTITGVQTYADSAVTLNVQLAKLPNGIKNRIEEMPVKIFPNPSHDVINLDAEWPIRRVEVYDLVGKRVYHQLFDWKKTAQIDLGNLGAGVYLLQLETEEASIVEKIIIQ